MQGTHNTLLRQIAVDSPGTITDYQANFAGSHIAIADSQGVVTVYCVQQGQYHKHSSFKADDSPVWKLSWADSAYGLTIAVGTFKKKVAIWQYCSDRWVETIFHHRHEGSVNFVDWAPLAYGLKLFSVGGDGKVILIELVNNNWKISSFHAHDCLVMSLAIKPWPLLNLDSESTSGLPILATTGKDLTIKIWQQSNSKEGNELNYVNTVSFRPHKDTIRGVLWRQAWGKEEESSRQLISCSEDGFVKETTFDGGKQVSQSIICQHSDPIMRISQSLTGNILTVTVVANDASQNLLYSKNSQGVWVAIDTLSG